VAIRPDISEATPTAMTGGWWELAELPLATPAPPEPPLWHRRRPVRAIKAIAFAALAAFALHTGVGLGGRALDSFFNDWVYNALIIMSAAGCLIRSALVRHERWAWLALGIGLSAWSAAEILSTVWLNHLASPPYPSIADAL
jgi:hypothetical protein